MPEQFERVVTYYGHAHGAVLLRKSVAQKLADQMIGKIIDQKTDLTTPFLRGISLNPCIVDLSKDRYKIVDCRLEDDPGSTDKGRVIAICEPIEQPKHTEPYRPQGMEYK